MRLLPALLVALALTAAACGGEDDDARPATTTTAEAAATADATTTAPTTAPEGTVIEVVFAGGSVEGGVRTHKVEVGETVILRITSDVADEVHVHGYDEEAPVAPGAPTEIRFDAAIPGVWEVELHHAGKTLLELQVGG